MERSGFRIGSVRAASPEDAETPAGATDAAPHRLGAVLLAASPAVAAVGPGRCRVDARGWDRRGGEVALARALLRAAGEAGFADIRVGIADSAVAADAAAALAVPSPVLVPVGGDRAFLAPLPLSFLPLSAELRETLRALGLCRIGEVAALGRAELEARFGPEGAKVRRLARGEDDRAFRPLASPDLPEARMELDGPVAELEPLLFLLRHLLLPIRRALEEGGRCAARLELELAMEGTDVSPRIPVVPARPTAREDALFDLCRAALERELRGPVRPGGPVSLLGLRVRETAAAAVRQGDLFVPGWRDPLAIAATLSRLRARVGEGGVVRPAPRPDHRPEARSRWTPVESEEGGPGGTREGGRRVGGSVRDGAEDPGGAGEGAAAGRAAPRDDDEAAGAALPPVLRLLPHPVPLEVRAEGGRPALLRDREGRRRVTAAEGPERISGDWWGGAPYRREYWRLATDDGELLWAFRERRDGRARWWLHGWWD